MRIANVDRDHVFAKRRGRKLLQAGRGCIGFVVAHQGDRALLRNFLSLYPEQTVVHTRPFDTAHPNVFLQALGWYCH